MEKRARQKAMQLCRRNTFVMVKAGFLTPVEGKKRITERRRELFGK